MTREDLEREVFHGWWNGPHCVEAVRYAIYRLRGGDDAAWPRHVRSKGYDLVLFLLGGASVEDRAALAALLETLYEGEL